MKKGNRIYSICSKIDLNTKKRMEKIIALKGYKNVSDYIYNLVNDDINSMETILGNTNIIKNEVDQLTRMMFRQTSINNRLMFYILENMLKAKDPRIDLSNWLNSILDEAAIDIIVEEDILGWGNLEKARELYEKDPQGFIKKHKKQFIYNKKKETVNNTVEKELEDYEDFE